MSDEVTPEERRALFRVVRGAPTDEELAALTVTLALVSAAGRDRAPQVEGPLGGWNDPVARLRATLTPGPGAWRASARPR